MLSFLALLREGRRGRRRGRRRERRRGKERGRGGEGRRGAELGGVWCKRAKGTVFSVQCL
jgi:hypothetical protein